MNIAGFGLPDEGERVVCGAIVYEWAVVHEIDEFHEQWGWSPFCHIADAKHLCEESELPVVTVLPLYE